MAGMMIYETGTPGVADVTLPKGVRHDDGTGMDGEGPLAGSANGRNGDHLMADTGMPQRGAASGASRNDSLGELVSLAIRDTTQLVKWEIDLAKLELREDVKRYGISGALLAMAGFVCCLVLVMLSFALAYGLITVGIWSWAAFLIVAGVWAVLAGAAALIARVYMRHPTRMRRTRSSVQDGIALLRHGDSQEKAGQVE
jgi:Putative Actinobacterial Holin-X, holin superfamily III